MAARNQEAQKAGIVYVFYNVDDPMPLRNHHKDRAQNFAAAFRAMPAMVVALHMCTDNVALKTAFASWIGALVDPGATGSLQSVESRYLFRFRSHFGNSRECRNNLATFGIPYDALPLQQEEDGISSLDLKYHKSWIARLEQSEENGGGGTTSVMRDDDVSSSQSTGDDEPSLSSMIPPPEPRDVILGRDGKLGKHPGNQRLKLLLLDRRSQYEAASRHERAAIVKGVLSTTKSNGCRFLLLSQEDNCWTEVGEEQCLDRIRHGFRNLRLADKSSTSAVKQPKASDVILGKNKKWVQHSGNFDLKRLLEEHQTDFEAAPRYQKTHIIRDLYAKIRSKGIRFLSQSPAGTFVEVSEARALDRIGHGFRNLRKLTASDK